MGEYQVHSDGDLPKTNAERRMFRRRAIVVALGCAAVIGAAGALIPIQYRVHAAGYVTSEEYAEVLRAFKDGDPNGNGEADEIPLTGSGIVGGAWHGSPDHYFMNSFIYHPGNDLRLIQDERTGSCRGVVFLEAVRRSDTDLHTQRIEVVGLARFGHGATGVGEDPQRP